MSDRDRFDPCAAEEPLERGPAAKEALYDLVAGAFDRMGPSEEAEERMLAALVDARAEREGRAGLASRRARVLKALLPAAACLALLASVGALAYDRAINAPMGMLEGTSGGGALPPGGAGASTPDAAGGNAGAGEAPGAADAEGAAGEVAGRFPLVTLDSGQVLHVAVDDAGLPLPADPALVGAEVGRAVATGRGDAGGGDAETGAAGDASDADAAATPADDRASCTVYASLDVAHPFAVRYHGTEGYFWADGTG